MRNITRSRGFRNFMSKLYGIGASVVILGALFKINHYPGADWMLIIGLGTESLIFFFSAFEPPHVEPDWSLVYPELAHLYHEGKSGPSAPPKRVTPKHQGDSVTQELDKMLEQAKVGPELIESLGVGLRKFSENTAKLSSISAAAIATDDFVNNMQKATASIEKLAVSSEKSSELLEQDLTATQDYVSNVKNATQKVAELSEVYSQVSTSIKNDLEATGEFTNALKSATNSVAELSQKYTASAEQISKSIDSIDLSKLDGSSYNEQLKKVATNLASLNTVYELQLQGLNQQLDANKQIQNSVGQFMENIEQTAGDMNKYREELDALTRKISALNNVYGNMLSAMNVNSR